MNKLLIIIFSFLLPLSSLAQDTVRIVHLNVLNYGNFTSYCTNNNNNPDQKAAALRKIVRYLEPDIFTVNELGKNPSVHKHILDSAFNTGGINYYSRTSFSNSSNSSIINMLFYDHRKLTLKSSTSINTSLRDIDVHILYYNDPLLQFTADTAFLYVFIAHLKAGSEVYDEQERAAMTADLMTWLDNINQPGNYVLCGDMNLKSNSEQAWYNLTSYPNSTIVFHDPANLAGNWTGNPAYSMVHSQSTHLYGNSCASGGGLDDRFDFILFSGNIMNGADHFEYLDGSYNVLGQDGLRLNGSVLSPVNSEVPEEIAEALYDISDHLPVVTDLLIDQAGAGMPDQAPGQNLSFRTLTWDQQVIHFEILSLEPGEASVNIISAGGAQVLSRQLHLNQGLNDCTFFTGDLPAGLYILNISSNGSRPVNVKVIRK